MYKTDPAECIGSATRTPGCHNTERPGAPSTPSPRVLRALSVDGLRKSGASLAIGDLYAQDWLDLETLDNYRRAAIPVRD